MAFMTLICSCYTCGRIFTANPNLVPSLPATLTRTGEKEPVCLACVKRANPDRIKNGLPEIVVLKGAYEPEQID